MTGRREENVGSYWINLRKGGETHSERESSRSHNVEGSLWKTLWICRETDYSMNE
jgi:hypothetical protein